MEKQSGIYKIQSKIHPERIYIGSSVNIKKRIWDHKTNLNALCHKNPKLKLSRWHLGKKLSPESIVKRTATQKLNKEIKLKNTLC